MTLINDLYTVKNRLPAMTLIIIIKLLCPFAPHLCEEMWESVGGEGFLSFPNGRRYDETKTVESKVEIGVQINGKVRATISYPNGSDKNTVPPIAKKDSRIASLLDGKNIVKEIYVPNKILNFVVK